MEKVDITKSINRRVSNLLTEYPTCEALELAKPEFVALKAASEYQWRRCVICSYQDLIEYFVRGYLRRYEPTGTGTFKAYVETLKN